MRTRWFWKTAVVLLILCVPHVAAGSVTGTGTAWAVWGSNGLPGLGVVALGTAEEVDLTVSSNMEDTKGETTHVREVTFTGTDSQGTCTATTRDGAVSVSGEFSWSDRTWSCSDLQVDPGALDAYDPCSWTVTLAGRGLTGLPVDEVSVTFHWVSCTATGT